MVDRLRVAIVHLGRPQARGEGVRVASWERIVAAAGGTTTTIPLLSDHRPRIGPTIGSLAEVAAGHIVPEALTWSSHSVIRQLQWLEPDLVVCMTSRAYHPALRVGPWKTVLDHVDRLGASYDGRSRIARSALRRATYRGLARTARRFERSPATAGLCQVAAGWLDAEELDALWLPIVVERRDPRPEPESSSAVDVCFVGTLSYPPNVEAVRVLSTAWPQVCRTRPGATALIAGANPIPEVRALAAANGWELVPNFADSNEVYRRARVAVSPLRTATGIQIKILDAASHGVAQVVSPRALTGLAPGFPARVADSPDAFAAEIVRLAEHRDERERLASAASAEINHRYVPDMWASAVDLLLSDAPSSAWPSSAPEVARASTTTQRSALTGEHRTADHERFGA